MPSAEFESELDLAVAARKRHTRNRLNRLEVTQGLSTEQQSRLVEIVACFDGRFQWWRDYPQSQQWLRNDAKYGAATRRVLKKKVDTAERAINDALERVTRASRTNEFVARVFETLVTPHLREAREALGRIRWSSKRLTEPTSTRVTAFGRSLAADPKADARAELSDFFIRQAKLKKREADRRTALIEREFGWGQVAINDEYVSGSSGAQGSSAIRHSRTRRQRRDATRKSRQ
jgi:hypothetical protein